MTAKWLAGLFWTFLCINIVVDFFLLPPEIVNSMAYDVVCWAISISLIFAWFILDVRERNYSPSRALRIAVLLVPIFALPYYKFMNFGFLAGLKFLGALALGVTMVILVVLGMAMGLGADV